MLNKLSDKRGITLIEIIITIAILGIVIIPLTTLFVNATRNTKLSEDLMIATSIAQKYLEKIKSKQISVKEDDKIVDYEYKDFSIVVKKKNQIYTNTQDENREEIFKVVLCVKKNDVTVLDDVVIYVVEEVGD